MIQETQKMHYLGLYMGDMTTFVTKQKPDWSVAYQAALVWSEENAVVDQILLGRQKQMLFYSEVNETQRIISCYKTLQ
jgi:hypothetical protein